MAEKVVLIRKQNTPFGVNYPYGENGRIQSYNWLGTIGNKLNKVPVPMEVFEWLKNNTRTFEDGCLIIDKENIDEDVQYSLENIENIEKVEQGVLTKSEIETLLSDTKTQSLKKKLDELVKDCDERLTLTIKRSISNVAQEVGIDSGAKRKVVAEWLGVPYENSDVLFDKSLKEMYDK